MISSARLPPRYRWIGAAAIVLAGLGAIWGWREMKAPRITRVLLMDSKLEREAGFEERSCAALEVLVKDHLEILTGASVSLGSGNLEPETLARLHPEALVLRLRPRRVGENLALGAAWAKVSELRDRGEWRQLEGPVSTPLEAVLNLVQSLPLRSRPGAPSNLAPRTPRLFWELLSIQGGSGREGEARSALEAAAEAEPDCAALHLALGELLFFRALQATTNDEEGLRSAESRLLRGLQLSPRHPRGSWLLARLLTDTSRAKEALELLLETRQTHPNAMPPVIGLTYAARFAGLLELSALAEARCDDLAADRGRPTRLQVAFLYLGDWDRYEPTLWTSPGDPRNSTVYMKRGQLHLARGQKEKALEAFREGSASPVGYAQFIRLSKVFQLILEGDTVMGRSELDALAESRVGLRVPDGEFVLGLAEAYALLGDHRRAQELAEKAFYAGFTSVRWFETSPILKPLHGTARWRSLVEHVRERQALLEAKFPRRRWGL